MKDQTVSGSKRSDAEGGLSMAYFASFFSPQSFDYNRSRTSSLKGWPIALQTSLSLCHSGLLPNRVFFDLLSRSLFRCPWFVFRFCALAGRCLCRVLQWKVFPWMTMTAFGSCHCPSPPAIPWILPPMEATEHQWFGRNTMQLLMVTNQV